MRLGPLHHVRIQLVLRTSPRGFNLDAQFTLLGAGRPMESRRSSATNGPDPEKVAASNLRLGGFGVCVPSVDPGVRVGDVEFAQGQFGVDRDDLVQGHASARLEP